MNDTNNCILKLKNLTKVYRTSEVETTALKEINLEIKAGEFVAIMGPSGCGKSSLLNIIGMLDRPSSGQHIFLGKDVAKLPESALSGLRKEAIGFVFQNFNLIDELTVGENVEIALLYHKEVTASDRKTRVKDALSRMKLSHRLRHMPGQLSGGQQQRAAIARAVVARPKLILADEPTGNLDSTNGEEVMQLLTEIRREGTTVVMVTHSHEHAQYAGRVINLLDGAVVNETYRPLP